MRYIRTEETDLGALLADINMKKLDELHKASVMQSVSNLKKLDDFYSGARGDWYSK